MCLFIMSITVSVVRYIGIVQNLGESKEAYGVDNGCTSEMRAHHSDHVFHPSAQKKQKNMSSFSNQGIFVPSFRAFVWI